MYSTVIQINEVRKTSRGLRVQESRRRYELVSQRIHLRVKEGPAAAQHAVVDLDSTMTVLILFHTLLHA